MCSPLQGKAFSLNSNNPLQLMQHWLKEYVSAQHKALDSVSLDGVERLMQTLRSAWLRDQQIFAIGNFSLVPMTQRALASALHTNSSKRARPPAPLVS